MMFDLVSFLAGVVAGGLTGALAGILHGFERTADLQENLLKLKKEFNSIDTTTIGRAYKDPASEAKMRELHAELDSINEEIRKMYRKNTS